MKVKVEEISLDKEELSHLYVHSKDTCIDNLITYLESDSYRSLSINCYQGEEIFKVQSNDIFYIETEKEHLLLHTNNAVYSCKNRLYELEKILPNKFIRISKSTILNLEKVSLYKPLLNGLMEVKLQNSKVTFISRKYLKEVRDRIKGGI